MNRAMLNENNMPKYLWTEAVNITSLSHEPCFSKTSH